MVIVPGTAKATPTVMMWELVIIQQASVNVMQLTLVKNVSESIARSLTSISRIVPPMVNVTQEMVFVNAILDSMGQLASFASVRTIAATTVSAFTTTKVSRKMLLSQERLVVFANAYQDSMGEIVPNVSVQQESKARFVPDTVVVKPILVFVLVRQAFMDLLVMRSKLMYLLS